MKQIFTPQGNNKVPDFFEVKKQAQREYQGYMGQIGIVHIEVFDQFGKFKAQDERWTYNKVTDMGDNYYADVISGSRLRNGTFLAIGSGTNGGSKQTTALEFEVSRGAVDSTYPQVGAGANDNDTIWRRTFTGLTANGVAEAGIFTASSGGTMVDRGTFSGVNIASADSLQVTITITALGV